MTWFPCTLSWLGECAQERTKERTTTELSSTRDQNEYISGETQTFVSLSCQLSTPELQHVCCSYPGGGRNLGSEELYEGWRITLYGWRGGTAEEMRRTHSSRNEAGLTEVNFMGRFIKTRMGLITNSGTFSKCGLPPTQYYIQSFFSSMYISSYKFSRSFDSAM